MSVDRNGMPLAIGDTVRTIALRGHLTKAEAGRNMTVRAFSLRSGCRVDNGDPTNADIGTNGFTESRWLPFAAIERVGRAP